MVISVISNIYLDLFSVLYNVYDVNGHLGMANSIISNIYLDLFSVLYHVYDVDGHLRGTNSIISHIYWYILSVLYHVYDRCGVRGVQHDYPRYDQLYILRAGRHGRQTPTAGGDNRSAHSILSIIGQLIH